MGFRRLGFVSLLVSVLITSGWVTHNSWAAETPSNTVSASTSSVAPKMAIVHFGETPIFEVKHGVGSFSAQDRADAVLNRIQALSDNPSFDPSAIVVVENESSSDIVAGDITVVSIFKKDAQSAKKSQAVLASEVASRMRLAIRHERSAKSPHQLMVSSVYAGLTTVVFILLLFLFHTLFPRFYGWVRQSRGRHIKGVRIRSVEFLTAQRIEESLIAFLGVVRVVLTLLILYIYIPLVFSYFPWTANFTPQLFGYIFSPIQKIGHTFVDFLPNVFLIVFCFFVTRYLLHFIRVFFNEIDRGRLKFENFHSDWAIPTYKLVRVLVIVFALIVIFPYLPGSGSPAFQGVSVFFGILLSLGSSSSIGNVVSGVVLVYMRPFAIGDRVKIADTVGDVVDRNLLVTRIRTIKNVDVTIPNAMILGSHMINYSSSAPASGLILHTTASIGYDVPWRQVQDLLVKAALATEHVLAEPKPFVLQTKLEDSYITYELNAYTNQPNRMATIYSDLHARIQDTFKEARIELMSPHQVNLHTQKAEPKQV